MSENQWVNGEFNPTFGPAAGTIEPAPAPWPTPEHQRQNPNWTASVPRPVDGDCEGYLLADRQQTWDEAEDARKERETYLASARQGLIVPNRSADRPRRQRLRPSRKPLRPPEPKSYGQRI